MYGQEKSATKNTFGYTFKQNDGEDRDSGLFYS